MYLLCCNSLSLQFNSLLKKIALYCTSLLLINDFSFFNFTCVMDFPFFISASNLEISSSVSWSTFSVFGGWVQKTLAPTISPPSLVLPPVKLTPAAHQILNNYNFYYPIQFYSKTQAIETNQRVRGVCSHQKRLEIIQ